MATANGNGIIARTIITTAITGFCGLCLMGFFYLNSQTMAYAKESAIERTLIKDCWQKDMKEVLTRLVRIETKLGTVHKDDSE